ncbi:MAG: ribonuclease domain-containing protein [Dermatophilaceae bacterium]
MKRILSGKTSWPLFGVLVAVLFLAVIGTSGGPLPSPRFAPGGGQTQSATIRAIPAPATSAGLLPRAAGEVPDDGTPSALPICALESLPSGVRATISLVHSRGPFPVPDRDGGTYANREGLLEAKQSGYYREYTVPGTGTASSRLVTGGVPSSNPQEWYYSADSYRSWCQIPDVP